MWLVLSLLFQNITPTTTGPTKWYDKNKANNNIQQALTARGNDKCDYTTVNMTIYQVLWCTAAVKPVL